MPRDEYRCECGNQKGKDMSVCKECLQAEADYVEEHDNTERR